MDGVVATGDTRGAWGLVARARTRLLFGVQALVLGVLASVGGFAMLTLAFAPLPGLLYLSATTGGSPKGHGALAAFLTVVFVGVAAPIAFAGPRLTAWLSRLLVDRWCGVTIVSPYRPYEEFRAERGPGRRGRIRWLLTDPATWRDMVWTAAVSAAVTVAAGTPGGLVRVGVDKLVGYHADPAEDMFNPAVRAGAKLSAQIDWWMNSTFQLGCLTLLVVSLLSGLILGRRLLTGYGAFARVLLGPTKQAELRERVRHLSETRSTTLDTGAAAMRRIERDLHDGAQARLVATGMTLGAAEALIDSNPAAARALLMEAKESSAKALAELRDLVRGIHPPVLADRGLTEALRALALDLPMRAEVSGTLPGRPPGPVESAAYFTVSELLANVVKHAAARQAWVDIRHTDGILRIGVTDDGRGGAAVELGTGLRGVEQRLAAFDGVLAVSSPLGGPTVVNLEIPCALSSPKTSTSSGTD